MDALKTRGFLLATSLLAWTATSETAIGQPAAAGGNAGQQKVSVIRPTSAHITRYLEMIGSIAASQSASLMARVSGTLESIDIADGAIVKKGTTLFVIEPLPYESKLRQAQAAEDQQRAAVVQADAEYVRQAQLRSSSASSQASLDNALAARDSARAALQQAQELTRQAAITYTYTRVTAPFDGIVTAHLMSVGDLVGTGSPTKLATILQLDPVWANASISESDVRRARAAMAAKGLTIRDLGSVPVEAALPGESGFPHRGTLDYVAPMVDPASGTLAVRGIFENPKYVLLPGNFVKMRIPAGEADVLLLPDDAIASDQGMPTVFVVSAAGEVRQQTVQLGGSQAGMQIVETGLKRDDRVVASATAQIAPGVRVTAVEAAARPAATAKP